MDSKTYTIEIIGKNGSFSASGLTMNGSNYVSGDKVATEGWPATFKFIARDEEGTVTESFDHAKLIQQEQYDWDGGKFYLAFAPLSQEEAKYSEIQSQIDYLALMADIEINK